MDGQASLSLAISQSLLKLMSVESVMPSNYLFLCHPIVLLILANWVEGEGVWLLVDLICISLTAKAESIPYVCYGFRFPFY